MPRIPDNILESVVYIYPSPQAAKDGERAGGSGFVVGVRSTCDPESRYLYVVTCRHVVEDGQSRTIRFNTLGGGTDTINYTLDEWLVHPDGHDIAVCPIPAIPQLKIGFIPDELLITHEVISKWKIGPGDDVFVMGRFVGHDGVQLNTPVLRSGNLSMLPGEPIRQSNGHLQSSFLVEAHSIGGYSGSPVCLVIWPADRPFRKIVSSTQNEAGGLWLLGVDWGHIVQWQPMARKSDPDDRLEDWGIQYNTLMMGVVPAWQLRELLDIEDFVKMRKELDSWPGATTKLDE